MRRSFLLSWLCLCLVVASSVACTQRQLVEPRSVGLSDARLASIDALLQDLVDRKKIAGGVALVARRDQVAHVRAVGMQDVASGTPMAADTIFRICSMTKPITSAGILMLRDEGRLALSDPLSKYLPEFRDMKVAIARRGEDGKSTYELVPADREITIHHLLTHTSGLTYGFFGREYFAEAYRKAGVSDGIEEVDGTIGDNVERLARLPLKHHPGTAWEYSLATDVLGHVIEVVSGQPLDAFFATRIFEPLRMTDTGFRVPDAKRSRLATVYRPREDQTIEELPAGVVTTGAAKYTASYPYAGAGTYFSGGAGLVSTVRDYSRFLRMLQRGGELDGVRLLSPETVELMTTDHCPDLDVWIKAHGDSFGLGFGVVTEAAQDQGLGSVGTYSWGGFYHTYFFVDPTEELIGIVMTQLYPWSHLTLWADFRRLTCAALAADE